MATSTERLRLRRMLGDRIPPGGDENDAFFATEEIDDLIATHVDFNLAAFHGWLDKMAEFAKLVDRNISGADMRLSKLFNQAESMAKHYGALAGVTEVVIGRMVGRAVSLRETGASIAVMTGAGAFRSEARNLEARRIMQRSHPEMLEDGHETYPEPGVEATS